MQSTEEPSHAGHLAQTLVLDTNAFIRRDEFWKLAESFVTIQEVLDEVKDEQTREFVQMLPVPLQVQAPSKEAYKAVAEFARQTGDLLSLSRQDMSVLALAYDLDVAAHGGDASHLLAAPQTADITSVSENTSRRHAISTQPLMGYGEFKYARGEGRADRPLQTMSSVSTKVAKKYEELRALYDDDDSGDESMLALARRNRPQEPRIDQPPGPSEHEPAHPQARAGPAHFESGEWITEEMLLRDRDVTVAGSAEALSPGPEGAPDVGAPLPVVLYTADNAMQNVALQMRLKVASLSGVIRSVRRFAGKCSSCLAVSPTLDSPFCKECGNKTMMKVAMYLSDDGVARFSRGIKSFDLRGTVYRLPTFVSKHYLGRAGRRTVVPILAANDPGADVLLPDKHKVSADSSVQHFSGELKGPSGEKACPSAQANFLRRNPNEAHRGPKKSKHYV